ncbi:MAG: ABC transporter permease [Lentilitoribacter sp.]
MLKAWRRIKIENEFIYLFLGNRVAQLAAFVALICILGAVLAPLIAPSNPYDLATFDILDSFTPPAWSEGGNPQFFIGTDDQGRDLLSSIMYGMRLSLIIGVLSVTFAAIFGTAIGVAAGYLGGRFDTIVMRIADVQLSLPAILTALLVDGIARGLLPREQHEDLLLIVLSLAIGLSLWVNFARTARASTFVERNKEYVQAAEIIGLHPVRIMLVVILPNILSPLLVIGTVDLAVAILLEATLSFLGVGVPPNQPSLGTLIRIGTEYIFSGEWWIVIFPSFALIFLIISINVLGDFFRAYLNPRLR